MSHQLHNSLTRILTADGSPVGVGFLAAENLILTCAHVIDQAIGAEENAHFDFPLLAPGETLSGRVSFRDDEQDIACIKVEKLPRDAAPVRLVQTEELWGHNFRAFGVPSGHDSGVWASGVLRDQNAQGWLHIEDTKTTGFAVQPGFSGGPIWDESLQAVVGMVVAAERDPSIKAAFCIPTKNLHEITHGLGVSAIYPRTNLKRYLEMLVAHNRYLQLQGIYSQDKLINIELEQVYIRLRATKQRDIQVEKKLLEWEASLAPGEANRLFLTDQLNKETTVVSIEDALAEYRHLVILGDPGSGKTTLLRYLALLYGRDMAEQKEDVITKLGLNEAGYLPVFISLRQVGLFLEVHHTQNDGTDGHAFLFDFFLRKLKNQQLEIPVKNFEEFLETGKAIILLDGLDEVANANLRGRVARLVEDFTLVYPKVRFVVTSRIVGYSGYARLNGDYIITTICDFTLSDVHKFLSHWYRVIAMEKISVPEKAKVFAKTQTKHLLETIQTNERVRDLAINPLMLTVIALVYQSSAKLPDLRAELYEELITVMLSKWDEARGVKVDSIVQDQALSVTEQRLLLQCLALHMHERNQREIELGELQHFLQNSFRSIVPNNENVNDAIELFLKVIEERTGLLVARGKNVYAFAHLTFQEYFSAVEIAAKDNCIEYILPKSEIPWWKEVVLLVAGYLSTQSIERATNLIKSISEKEKEPTPYHNFILASECIRDIGKNRIDKNLEKKIVKSIKEALNVPQRSLNIFERYILKKEKPDWITLRAQAVEALARIGEGYWYHPYGEPEWVTIPAGKFWMGGDGRDVNMGFCPDGITSRETPRHEVMLPEYKIARIPITNYQYGLFVKATKYSTPEFWEDNYPPKGLESHPVTAITWYDALYYCEWLSEVTGKQITLPSEAEWEKAARGDKDKRTFPWGDVFDKTCCNSAALSLGFTTPAGIFTEGQSPYHLLDMSGNVYEWTRSIFGIWDDKTLTPYKYPYRPGDGRERIEKNDTLARTLRGGNSTNGSDYVRCAHRFWEPPNETRKIFGFRVVISPGNSPLV